MTLVDTTPYYQVSAQDLASWLVKNAQDASWSVDGDNLLTSRLDFPCPTEELAKELERIGGEMFVRAPANETGGIGETIGQDRLDAIVRHERATQSDDAPTSRALYLRWDDQDVSEEWVLIEDVA
jgi:hypothetical protein